MRAKARLAKGSQSYLKKIDERPRVAYMSTEESVSSRATRRQALSRRKDLVVVAPSGDAFFVLRMPLLPRERTRLRRQAGQKRRKA